MKTATRAQWIAVVAVGVLALWVYRPTLSHHSLKVRGFESIALASSLAEGKGFSDPFQTLPTGPSAQLAPVYPAVIAVCMRLFGEHAGDVLVYLNWVLLAVQLMLLPLLASQLGLGFWAGVLAVVGWFATGIPPIYIVESTLAALVIVTTALVMSQSFSASLSRIGAASAAVLWGSLILMQPVAVLIFPVWLWVWHREFPDRSRRQMAVLIVAIFLVSPWIVRNYAVFIASFLFAIISGLNWPHRTTGARIPFFQ
jgi:hypothetical protein